MSEEKSFTDRLTGIIRDARKHGPLLSGEGEWVGEPIDVKIEDSVEENNAEPVQVEETATVTEREILTDLAMVTESSSLDEVMVKETKPLDEIMVKETTPLNEIMVKETASPDEIIVKETESIEAKPSTSKSYIDEISSAIVTAEQDRDDNATADEVDETENAESREELLRLAAILAVIRAVSSRNEPTAKGRSRGTSFAQDHRRGLLGVASLASARSSRSAWR